MSFRLIIFLFGFYLLSFCYLLVMGLGVGEMIGDRRRYSLVFLY